MFIEKDTYNWKYIMPMAFFTAWLWSYPLFGHLQMLFLYNESLIFIWNLLFLSGLSIGFFSHVFKLSKVFLKVHISIIMFAAAALMFLSSRISPDNSQITYYISLFSSFLLGIISSLYITRWSSKLVLLKKNQIGSNMGMMMLLASVFYTLQLILGDNLLSFYTAFVFLIFSSFYSEENLKLSEINENSPNKAYNFKQRLVKFWMPFVFILLAFYIFSGILLNYIFPSVRLESPYMYIFASMIYGTTAFIGGTYLDRFKKLENIVLLGIIFLGVFYFLSPVLQILPVVNIGLEISYALIDLFIWVGIAYASITFKYNPVRCFGFGLGMNIFFVLVGFLAGDFGTGAGEVFDFYSIALLVGIMMLISIFPAVSMKNINILNENKNQSSEAFMSLPENLTPRERQVFKLLMTKMTNDEIQDRLSISKNTLKTHIRNVYAKSKVKSRYELVVKYKVEKKDEYKKSRT